MEQTGCSKTLTHKIQTSENHPKERIQHTQKGEILNQEYYMYIYMNSGIMVFYAEKQIINIRCCKESAAFIFTGRGVLEDSRRAAHFFDTSAFKNLDT
jgi:hypothetical protein